MNLKHIHIGRMIEKEVAERGIEISRICNFMNCMDAEIEEMYSLNSLDAEVLLKWSKLLEYDFFRIYSQHLILYAPVSGDKNNKTTSLPKFRKNIYTKEIIDFILEQVSTEEMTKNQIIERYKIPKTTLYKWISKYKK